MTQAHAVATPHPAPPTSATARHQPAAPSPSGGSEFGRVAFERAFGDPVHPVSPSVRGRVESAVGMPLGEVRVHTGPHVRTAARGARAAAFAIGHDIGVAVDPGQAIPEGLLEHELIHVAQQATDGDATPADAERQAARRGWAAPAGRGPAGGLLGTGGVYPAFAAGDWLQSTPNVRQYGFTELVDELRAVNEWFNRQTASSPESDRMMEAKAAIEGEIARRQGAIRAADRPPPRRRGRASAQAAQPELPEQTEMPRVLRDRTSTQLTDPAEIRTEVDRITAWLQRPDLGRADRSILRQELTGLQPGLGADLNRSSVQRQQNRLAQAFTPAAGADRSGVLENIRMIESIRPYQEQPGMAYVMHNGELLVFPQEVGDRVRAEAVAALQEASRRAHEMNESTQFRMREHMRLNYDDQYIVGFFVSVVSGEEPVELQTRMLGPLSVSNIALSRYRTAQHRGSLVGMADAVYTAVEKADAAQTIVLNGINRAMSAAGSIVSGLTITRNLSFAIALSIGAILAAPVVAAGVAGTGATGLLATGMTALGTGTVVGGEGFVLGFAGGAGGELVAGHGGRAALSTGLGEGRRVGEQGFAIGVGGGASVGLARNLGVSAVGLTRGAQLGRSALAGAGGNALGSFTGAALSDVPEGQSRAGFMLRSTAWGAGLGAFGGAAGAGSQWLSSPAARFGVGVGLPSLAGGGATYLQTGDWSQSLQAGAQGLAVGGLAMRAPTGVTPAQQRAFQFGRGLASTTRAYTTAAMLGLSNVSPALRMGESPASVTLSDPRQSGLGVPAEVQPRPAQPAQPASVQPAEQTAPGPVQPAQQVQPPQQAQRTSVQQAPAEQAQQPRLELSDRGVRPAPGTRTETQAAYRLRMGAQRWRAAVEAAFAGDLADQAQAPRVTGGQSDPRIAGARVPGRPPARLDIENVPQLAGETQQQAAARVRTVIGHTISEFPGMEQRWNDARASVLSRRTLTQANSRELFDATREAFYRRLRGDPAAEQILNDAGLELAGANSTAPRLQGAPAGSRAAELTVSLDHVVERAADWQRALDANNLRFEFAAPNTDREIVQMRHPELRP